VAWLNRDKAPLGKNQRTDTPDGLWERCDQCGEIALARDFYANQNVCPKCNFHFYLPVGDRIKFLLDEDTFEEFDGSLCSNDPLEFQDTKTYKDRLIATRKQTGRNDAFIAGRGLLNNRPIQLGIFDFEFMGGSMGAVVGEKIVRLFERAAKTREVAVIFSSSGGARMHEGLVSLMQMAKTCAALGRLRDQGVPFISVLTHPTTGGVAASFAMLGDINLAEPGALIGFAGPRVIEQTIGQTLPEGFQRSEFLLEHGMLDLICERDRLRPTLTSILEILSPQ
jgi:acetyl-CoA carboxylase carboxyl transferase subunit beta